MSGVYRGYARYGFSDGPVYFKSYPFGDKKRFLFLQHLAMHIRYNAP